MDRRSVGLLASDLVDVNDEFLTIAANDASAVSPMTTAGDDDLIIDSENS